MDLSQLEVFLTVARERCFSRAAEKLFRTQSAVSQTIRKSQLEIGGGLSRRVGVCGPTPTFTGFGGRGQHLSVGDGVLRRSHRKLALSRQSHRSLPPAQDPPAHGRRAAHSARHQALCKYGKWRG